MPQQTATDAKQEKLEKEIKPHRNNTLSFFQNEQPDEETEEKLPLLQSSHSVLYRSMDLTQSNSTASTKSSDSLLLNHLPDDMLFMILSYLPRQDLFHLSLTCKKFYNLCEDKVLWQSLALAQYPEYEKTLKKIDDVKEVKKAFFSQLGYDEKLPKFSKLRTLQTSSWYISTSPKISKTLVLCCVLLPMLGLCIAGLVLGNYKDSSKASENANIAMLIFSSMLGTTCLITSLLEVLQKLVNHCRQRQFDQKDNVDIEKGNKNILDSYYPSSLKALAEQNKEAKEEEALDIPLAL